MRHFRWVLLLAFALTGPAVAAQDVYTVGDVTMRLAALLEIDAETPEAAREALSLEGITVRPALSSPLLEGDAVEVFNQMGLQLATEAPDRSLDADSVDRLFGSLLSEDQVGPAGPALEGTGGGRPCDTSDPVCRRKIRKFCRDHPTNPKCEMLASRFGMDP